MRYSEIKPIIDYLHARGWRKMPGGPTYYKVWSVGNFHYQRVISFDEVINYKGSLAFFFDCYDEYANRQLRNERRRQSGYEYIKQR